MSDTAGTVRLFVPGCPAPEGSTKAMPFLMDCTSCRPGQPCGNRRMCAGGRRAAASVIHDNDGKLRAWRDAVASAARPHFPRPLSGPVDVTALFLLHRPQGHRGSKGAMLAAGRARPRPTVIPDGDKLLRACLDALTDAGAWTDDAQAVDVRGAKIYTCGMDEGLVLEVRAAAIDAHARDLLAHFGAEVGDDGDVWPVGRGGGQASLIAP